VEYRGPGYRVPAGLEPGAQEEGMPGGLHTRRLFFGLRENSLGAASPDDVAVVKLLDGELALRYDVLKLHMKSLARLC
jgi:hypothetical protein